MKSLHYLALGAIAAALLAGGASANPIVTNGSFETGDTTGWTLGGPGWPSIYVHTQTGAFGPYTVAEDGSYYLVAGPLEAVSLSQTITDTSGQDYEVDFWLSSNLGVGTASFTGGVNGTTDVDLSSNPVSFTDWTKYTMFFTGTGSDTLEFTFVNGPTYWAFDNVSVTAITAPGAPEPATWALMLTGFAGLGVALRSRRKLATV